MNFSFWVAFLFGITIVFYFLGGQTQLSIAIQKYSSDATIGQNGMIENGQIEAIIKGFVDSVLSWNTLFVGTALIAAVAMGFNLLALIPLGATILILNYAVFPTEFISTSGFPPEIKIPLMLFFTLTEIMIIFSLVRGSFR